MLVGNVWISLKLVGNNATCQLLVGNAWASLTLVGNAWTCLISR